MPMQLLAQNKPLSLDDILQRIEQNNLLLQTYALKAESYTYKAKAATAWMAPMVGAGTFMTPYPGQKVMDEKDKGSIMLQLEQDIPNPSKLNAQKRYIASKGDVELAGRGIAMNTFKAQAKSLYYNWIVATQRIQVLKENDKIMQMMKKIEQIRYPYNQSQLSGVFRAGAKIEENQNMIRMQEGEIAKARAWLNSLMNLPGNQPLQIDSAYNIRSMKLGIGAMQAQARPDFKLRFDHMSPLGGMMPKAYSVMGMISIPIAPWASKMYKSEVKAMDYEIKAMEKQLAAMEDKIVPALKRTLDADFANYQENKLQINAVIGSWEALTMMQANVLDEKMKNYIVKALVVLLLGTFAACRQKTAPSEHKTKDKTAHSGQQMQDSSLNYLLKPVNEQVIASIPLIRAEKGSRIYIEQVQGRAAYDSRNERSLSSRTAGRIEKLYVKYNYQPVKKGQLILELYSPDLAAAQQELLLIQRTGDTEQMLGRAKQRLALMGMSEAEIQKVLKSGKISYRIPVYSNASGYILEKGNTATVAAAPGPAPAAAGDGMGGMAAPTSPSPDVAQASGPVPVLLREGQYLSAGQSIFTIYRAGELLAEFALRPEQAARLSKTAKVIVQRTAQPEQSLSGRIGMVQPMFNAGENFVLARVYLQSKDLQVGELLTGQLPFVSPENATWLPKQAVLSLGNRSIVFKKEHQVFVPRTVKTGIVQNGQIQILDEIGNWELAKNAYYLIDSENFIRKFAIAALLPSVFIAACTESKNKGQKGAGQKTQTYTCPMHPQIVQDKAGTCPICGMDLVPFEKNATEAVLHLDESQMALANISVIAIGAHGMQSFKQLNGRLVVNPESTTFLSSRI
eukprot:gene15017-18185_t